jgi:prepilin-type N-terminal cleavage/methylation domain-containing protein
MAIARKGFSIIEVLAAVIITSIAGMAPLQAAAQGRRIYDVAKKNQKYSELTGLIALSSNLMGGSGENDLGTLISSRYTIDNEDILDPLRKHYFILKTQDAHLLEQSFDRNETKKMVAMISKNSIDQTTIEMEGKRTILYGLSGEGW